MEVSQLDHSEIFTVPSDEINANWMWIAPFIEQCETPGWDAWDIRRALLKKEAQLWACRSERQVDGIWITRIENSYSQRWGLAWVTAGSGLRNVELYREHIEPWFKEKGCAFVEIVGRKGWKKILSDYEEKATILVKQL